MKREKSTVLVAIMLFFVGLISCSNVELIAGNGKIVKKEIDVKDFKGVCVSAGLDVTLVQDSFERVVIETDENMLEYVKFENNDGVLNIYRSEGRSKPTKVKIYVTAVNIEKLYASSGADIKGAGLIKTDYLEMDASSAADITVEVRGKYVVANSSSGADINILGEATVFNATASSGADIKAKSLIAGTTKANASSGADIAVCVKEEIIAEASSGGDVKVIGSPIRRDVRLSSGGDVTFEKGGE
ncbi:MAG TPA: head GIN domain-containing protein [Bacteroidales bacterium]|nr:head GIN domain-containing protein [Bacteroidales bacterium]